MRVKRMSSSGGVLTKPPANRTIHIKNGKVTPREIRYKGKESIFFETDVQAVVEFDDATVFGTQRETLLPGENPTEFIPEVAVATTTCQVFVNSVALADPPRIIGG